MLYPTQRRCVPSTLGLTHVKNFAYTYNADQLGKAEIFRVIRNIFRPLRINPVNRLMELGRRSSAVL